MLKSLKVLGVAAAAAVLMAAPAQAATVIDFATNGAGVGGSITMTGGNLIGSNIPIGGVTVFDSPANNGVFTVTGSATGTGGGAYGALNFNTGANTFSISGCVPELGVGTLDGCEPETLLTGSFQGWSTDPSSSLLSAFGVDTKNTSLLSALQLPTDTPFHFFGFSLTTGGGEAGGPRPVISTDIRNTAVPEPATMMLLGTGLLAAFRARRRQA